MNEVKAGLITSRRIIFTPDVDLKNELADTAIQITCHDRNGQEVKRVTSADEGVVEDPENENTGEGENQNGGNTNGGTNDNVNHNPNEGGGDDNGGGEPGADED